MPIVATWVYSVVSRSKDSIMALSVIEILDLKFLRFFSFSQTYSNISAYKNFFLSVLSRRTNAVANNTHRNCIENGIMAKTSSRKGYFLTYGIIAKMVKENEKSLMYGIIAKLVQIFHL